MTTPATPVESQYVDFGRAFQFFFEDPEWIKKIIIGGLFHLATILLVGIPFVIGYMVRVTQRAARGEAYPLPEWDDYGGIFMDGLRMFGLYLVHFLAALLLPGAFGCIFAIIGSTGGDAAGGLAAIGMMVAQLAMIVLLIPVLVLFPAAYIRTAITGRFSAGLEVRENIALIRRDPGNYFIAIAIYLVASFVAQFGVILCCIGAFPAAFWSMCVAGWAFGEVARRDAVLGSQTGYAQVFA